MSQYIRKNGGIATGAKLRVMQITEDLGVGGLERVVATLAKTIDRTRFEPSVLCLRDGGPFADELTAFGIPVHVVPSSSGRTDYLVFRKVARILREQRVDVLHTHNTNALVDGVIGAKLAGVKRVVHTDHARQFPDKLRYMVAEHALSYFVHKMVGVSEHTSENLRRYEKIAGNRIVTLPNGIDGSVFDRPVDLCAKRREFGIPEHGPVIGLGARLTEQKGVCYLLEAVPSLLERFPDLTVLIVGDGDRLGELKAQAAALGVVGSVRFPGMRLDLPEILRILDVYVLPSVWEGLPMAILEAQAARCPIVATRVGGLPTAITHGVSGSLVEPRNPRQLSAAVAELLADRELAERYRREGRRSFEAHFSAEAMTRKYERLYLGQELVEGPETSCPSEKSGDEHGVRTAALGAL